MKGRVLVLLDLLQVLQVFACDVIWVRFRLFFWQLILYHDGFGVDGHPGLRWLKCGLLSVEADRVDLVWVVEVPLHGIFPHVFPT